MTKKPQPLDNKVYVTWNFFREDQELATEENLKRIKEMVSNIQLFILFEDIKSACEFYLRYKDKPLLLIKEYPKYLESLAHFNLPKLIDFTKEFGVEFEYSKYNDWLFKLAFKDVFEK